MILQRCITLGLALAVKVLADEGGAQRPITDHGVETSSDCHNACSELVTVLGAQASYSSLPEDFRNSLYCGRQRDVTPACVLRPLTAQDVSVAVKTIAKHNCHFAIKSGGHAMFEGASNANGGITVDLVNLNALELSEDLMTASVGPGQRWGKVYEFLEKEGRVVVGGRVSSVGVGGYLLGGGISSLSRKYGWASDNVRNYEIVLANGSIANINYKSHPDLYWALRGGAGNFGIVTRFDLEAYELGPIWGGLSAYVLTDVHSRYLSLNIARPFSFSISHLIQSISQFLAKLAGRLGRSTTSTNIIQAFEDMVVKEKADESYLQYFMSFAYQKTPDLVGASVLHIRNKPDGNPPALADPVIMGGKPTYSTSKVRSLRSLVEEIDPYNMPGYRYLYHEITFRFNATVFQQIFDFYLEEVETVKHLPGIFPVIVIQPISEIARVGNNKNGGNPFGFTDHDGPICALLTTPQWDRAEDDEQVKASVERFVKRSMDLLEKEGLLHRWIYPNYANELQDVFAGYGEENRARLREIQKRYDPEGVFSRLQPGYFKV
ncbi:FAD-binding domain-containing protein [Stipitochalara longipes BDJ]|nr:FAD-binding domain-containing protein [Stipitochalara longipes BDJ]